MSNNSNFLEKYILEVYQENSIVPEEAYGSMEPNSIYLAFLFNRYELKYRLLAGRPVLDPMPIYSTSQIPVVVKEHILEPYFLSSIRDARVRLSDMLIEPLDVPLRYHSNAISNIIMKIRKAIETRDIQVGQRTGIVVKIHYATFDLEAFSDEEADDNDEEEEVDDDLFDPSSQLLVTNNNVEVKFVAADKAWISNQLGKTKFIGLDEECAICMEELEKETEVIKTPCLHYYHSDCIVQWLSTSHMCPLCRYEFPTESLNTVV